MCTTPPSAVIVVVASTLVTRTIRLKYGAGEYIELAMEVYLELMKACGVQTRIVNMVA